MAGVPAPRPLLGAVLLLFVSAAWGSAFPLMKDLIVRLPVEDLLAERYTIAAVTLFVIRPRCLRGLSRTTWANGLLLGLMFGVGQSAQAVALGGLPSAVSGFAVGCSVIFTPLLELAFFRTRVPRRVWAGVGLALAGMTVFTLLRGVEDHELSVLALGVTLSAAALYSGHTLLLARMTRRGERFDAYALTVIQLGTIGVLTGGLAVRDGLSLPASGPDWAILAHLSVISCALGFLARSYGQSHVGAVPSAVLMSSQPLWVAAIAMLWFDERAGWSMIAGGALMAGAMLLAVSSRSSPPAGEVPDPQVRNRNLVLLSRRAAKVLGELMVKRSEPPPRTGRAAVPYIVKSACRDTEACPWNGRELKGAVEPSLERLIERATLIVRARTQPGAGCCQSIILLGRCLCALMEESERNRAAMSPGRPSGMPQGWFRSR
jgi:drug/metabolite transporter (DMT)-like permease